MDDQTFILIGALGGSAVGVFGGVLGTYHTIRSAHGPRERAFAVWASVVCWIAILAFLAVMWVTPMPYRFLLWLPYMTGLLLAARVWNRRLERIRREETGSVDVP